MHSFIKENFFKDGKFVKQSVRAKKFDDFFAQFEENFQTKNRSEILWLIEHVARPVCRECGNLTDYKNYYEGYRQLCSDACARTNELTKERRIDAIRGTLSDTHGVINTMQLDSTKNKVAATNIKRHKVKWYVQAKDFKHASEQTSLRNWGTKNPQQSDVVKQRTKNNILRKYARSTARSFEETRANRIAKAKAQCVELDIRYGEFSVTDILRDTNYEFTHSCGLKWEQKIDTILPACPMCHDSTSKLEQRIREWIKTLDVKIKCNDRVIIKPLELDIYFPDHKIAIEVNGLYWHCDESTKRSVKEKTDLCAAAGVQLISIWEHEWEDQTTREKIQSILLAKLGISKRIFARHTKIVDVGLDEARKFLNANHLQGWASSTRTVGLKSKDGELLMLMSIGRRRWSGDEIEIIRLCSKMGIVVVGGFSKLLKLFKGQRLMSYCDRRFGSGVGYLAVGFTLERITKPNYLWWKHKTFLKRGSTTVKRLPKLLGSKFDPNLSENENMRGAGWRRLSDAGNLKFYLNTVIMFD